MPATSFSIKDCRQYNFHLADAAFAASKKKNRFFLKTSFLKNLFFFCVCGLIAYAQKKHHPRSCTTETVPANARSGARTLDTLKALGHFISVYYALFCVIKMPAIPLFIGHCGQYKTLWYFIIKCKKFKCLWEGF
jgi:hypothetical protein